MAMVEESTGCEKCGRDVDDVHMVEVAPLLFFRNRTLGVMHGHFSLIDTPAHART